MSSVFSQIIAGELPCYKIYEDDKTFVFLDNFPEVKGHVLVTPKKEVDKIYDLDDEDYLALMKTAKKISSHMDKVLGSRIVWKVVGTEVPHAHIHLTPIDKKWEYGKNIQLTPEEFEEIRTKLEYHE